MTVMEWVVRQATLPPRKRPRNHGPAFRDSVLDVLQYMSYDRPQTVESLRQLTGVADTYVRRTLALEMDCGNVRRELNEVTGMFDYYLAPVDVSLRTVRKDVRAMEVSG